MSSGLTSEDMEAGGIDGGPGEFFLTYNDTKSKICANYFSSIKTNKNKNWTPHSMLSGILKKLQIL